MIVSVTGTRWGMTTEQMHTFRTLLETSCRPTEFHHGACQGADREAADIVRDHLPGVRIIAHPGPDGDGWQAPRFEADETLPGKTHFARNRDLVDVCDVLIVCPRETERQERGGTWYTHDQGKKRQKHVFVIWPNGSLLLANGEMEVSL